MSNDILYIKEYKMIFERTQQGYYEPRYHDVQEIDGKWQGEEIVKGTIFYDFILWVKFANRKIDLKTGRVRWGFYELYQYYLSFEMIKSVLSQSSHKLLYSISRQSGKTFAIGMTLPFIMTFVPLYIADIKLDRFYGIVANQNYDLAEECFSKFMPYIDKAVEFFNSKYPKSNLLIKSKTIKNINPEWYTEDLTYNKRKIEFARVLNNKVVPYACIVALSSSETSDTSGLSSHVTLADESQKIQADHYNNIISCFKNSVAGAQIFIGTPNSDPTSVLYEYYYDHTTKKIRIPCTEVLKMKGFISDSHKQIYLTSYEEDLKKFKENSDFMKANWYVDFNISSDRFLTLQKLQDNSIVIGDLEADIRGYTKPNEYRVASLDGAVSGDRAILTTGISIDNNDTIKTLLKSIIILKDLDDTMNQDTLATKVVDVLINQQIDIFGYDNTGQQSYLGYAIYKEAKNRHCKTLIIPMGFEGSKKRDYFSYWESALFSQNVVLPSLEYKQTNPEYDLLLEELLVLKKEKKANGNGYEFKAPSGWHDDTVMSALILFNVLNVVKQKIKAREKIKYAGVEYFPTLRKYPTDSTPEQKTQRTSWLLC